MGFSSQAGMRLCAVIGCALVVCSAVAFIPSVSSEHPQQASLQTDKPGSELDWRTRELIAQLVGNRVFSSLTPEQRDAAVLRFQQADPLPPSILCFAPDTPLDVVSAFSAIGSGYDGPRYNQVSRWSSTANGGTGSFGDPITLTYSFAPDGTNVPTISGAPWPDAPNDFNAFMNGIYGSPAVWQPLFTEVFDRWSELCGITYVLEPNDDGVELNSSSGVLGVRGDLRIAGKPLDGNSGVLAYNNFPNDGDMVFDTADSYYSNNAGGSNLPLRNIISHEHGHGMGQAHVCPIEQTKLMEPFISTAYDGPRHDDIRNAHEFYGDVNEPDNNTASATHVGTIFNGTSLTLGTVPSPSIPNGANLSIDANGESDHFRFTITQPAAVTVTVTPIGLNYDDSDQACGGNPGSCCSGSFTDSESIANLNVEVIDFNGFTVLATGDSQPAGSVETVADVILDTANDYFVRVYEGNSPGQTQLYTIEIALADVPFLPLSISLPGGAPTSLAPGVTTDFTVQISQNDESLVGGSAALLYRFDGGSYQSVALVPAGGDLYTASLPPANCGDTPEFYVTATGTTTGAVNNPSTAPGTPFTAVVGTPTVAYSDDFQTDTGWAVTNNPSGGGTFDGQWERGDPLGGGDRGDPPDDFDGSGICFVTDNVDGNSDVDNGTTTVTSPVIDISIVADPDVSYARWFSNVEGDNPQQDTMLVEVSDNGGSSWVTLEVVGPSTSDPNPEVQGGWTEKTYRISDFVGITNQFQIRFTVEDADPGSIVEAGLDDFEISGIDCQAVVPVPNPPTGVSATDSACGLVQVTWNSVGDADDYEVWRNTVNNSGTASMIASGIVGTSYDDNSAVSGTTYFYWVLACNTSGCSGFSSEDSGVRIDGPGQVTGVSASDSSCDVVQVTWDAEAAADLYEIWRNTTNDLGTATMIDTTASTNYNDVTATPGVTYFYWVRATNACGDGAISTEDSGLADTAPAAVTGVAASDGACDMVQVTWDASAGATSYEIWRNTVNDLGTASLLDTSVAPSYDDGSATSGVTYFYWVRGVNACGNGGFSVEDSGSADTAPVAPTGATATDSSVCGAVDVSWNASVGATSYDVLRNTVNDPGTATNLGSTATTEFTDTTADPAQSYFYWVTATNACGSSSEGGPDSGQAAMKGDFNLDGLIDGADMQGFVAANLVSPFYDPCADLAAPFGTLDSADAAAFVALLLAP